MKKRMASILALLVFLGVVLVTAPENVQEHGMVREGGTVREHGMVQEGGMVREREKAREGGTVQERGMVREGGTTQDMEAEIPSETVSINGRETTEQEIEPWKTWAKIENGAETGSPEYCDEVIGVEYTGDLSLLEELVCTDHHYASRDGKVYYRQYHEDSFEQVGLWAYYDPVSDTEKEIVCIDRKGVKTTLFKDWGFGDFYLIGERFYMTERGETDSGREQRIYSVNMEGSDRIDYGEGEILVGDEKRGILLLDLYGDETASPNQYCVLDCSNGACMQLGFPAEKHPAEEENGSWDFEGYQDGWIYLSHYRWNWDDGRLRETELYVVSVEGEWNKVITLTSDRDYAEYIHQPEMLGDRIFFIFGGYAGSGQYYQGGSIITVKQDGTDCRLIRGVASNDRYPSNHYYLRQDEGKILVYYPCSYHIASGRDDSEEEDYAVTVWDIDTRTLRPPIFRRIR